MPMRRAVVGCVLVAIGSLIVGVCGLSAAVDAQEINKRTHAAPGDQSKINRVMPQSRTQSDSSEVNSSNGSIKRSCDMNVANVNIEKGQKAPKNVINVIRGDVIRVCR